MTEPSKTPRTDSDPLSDDDLDRLEHDWTKDVTWHNAEARLMATVRKLQRSLSEVTQRAERAEQDAAAVRALMNLHNLGGWTDAEAPMKAGRWALALVPDWVDTDRYDMREYVAARATLGFPALNGELPLPEAPK